MNKIAITYKGAFQCRKFKNDVEPDPAQLLSEIEETLENHKRMLYDYFKDSEVDFYFSTYDLGEKINELYKKNLNLKYYDYLSSDFLNSTYESTDGSWIFQVEHIKKIISAIKQQNISYDLFIFTRPDLFFLRDFSSLNIDFSKFNIVHNCRGGGCDDNLFVFPKEFLNSFEESMKTIQNTNRTTHQINVELDKRDVPVNYMNTSYKNDVFWLNNGRGDQDEIKHLRKKFRNGRTD